MINHKFSIIKSILVVSDGAMHPHLSGSGSPQTEDDPGISTSGHSTPGAVTPGSITPGSITPGSVTPGAVTPGIAADMLDISTSVDTLSISSLPTGHTHKV